MDDWDSLVETRQALGTHAGLVHILDLTGKRIKSYKPHLASVVDISMDETADFVSTASIDGKCPQYSAFFNSHFASQDRSLFIRCRHQSATRLI